MLFLCTAYASTLCRSPLRRKGPSLPQLTVRYADNDSTIYTITDSHIEEYPLFVVYQEDYFNDHRLPEDAISYRYDPACSVEGNKLTELIEKLLIEIKQGKRCYTDFILLQDKDFSHPKAAGLAVFRFKNYPFILKLFIETPESFTCPWLKGILPVWFFYMGGGTNRHITGLTRIANMAYIRNKIKDMPAWKDLVDMPRKWFWTPKEQRMIQLIGQNIAGKDKITACIPGTYAIIADAIEQTSIECISEKDKRTIALELCNALDLYIDPHIDNFMIEKGTHKLVIIDTEHFPTLVGLKKKVRYASYTQWYLGLIKKATYDIFFRDKAARKKAQLTVSELKLFDY
jgi:hypothetical protein